MTFFKEQAKDRLKDLLVDGTQAYQRLEDFLSIVQKYPNQDFVVPAEIDQALHEVLCARGSDGKGLEKAKINHWIKKELDSLGKTLGDLKDPFSIRTKELLEMHGFTLANDTYTQHACTVKLLSQ